MATRSSSATALRSSLTAPGPFTAAFSTGRAIAAILAPRARHLATSRPVRTPPEAIRGSSVADLASRMLAAVGMPQSQKVRPNLALSASPASRAR